MKLGYIDITTTEEREIKVYCGCGDELDVNDASDEKTEIQIVVNPHVCKEAQK